jgi:hypothetical protein
MVSDVLLAKLIILDISLTLRFGHFSKKKQSPVNYIVDK